MTPFDSLKRLEEISYDKITEEFRIVNVFLSENLEMDNEMIQLKSRELCTFYITDSFNSTETCKKEFGKILNYDFTIFSTNFIQKLRNIKNMVLHKFRTELVLGNLTNYDVDLWDNWGNTYSQQNESFNFSFKLDLFNDEILHSKMNLMFINIFEPYINENRKAILKYLSINGFKTHFILLFFILILLIFLIFFIYFLPMVNFLSNFIYKTKNMLSLIPMPILTAQGNIKSLLNLS